MAEVSKAQLDELLANRSGGVLVDFWSPWCRRCHSLRPTLEALAQEHAARWQFVAVNAEAETALAERFGVRALPTLIFCWDGDERDRITGSFLPSAIGERLEALST